MDSGKVAVKSETEASGLRGFLHLRVWPFMCG